MKPTAEQIFNYADRYARRREAVGKGTQYPTVREAAKRFRVPQNVIVDTVEGADIEDAYFGLAVAMGIPGAGFWELHGGEQLIEAYR
jgi:hypothetical protein